MPKVVQSATKRVQNNKNQAKMEPKGPNLSHKGTKTSPKGTNLSHEGAKTNPKDPNLSHGGTTMSPKGAKRITKMSPKSTKTLEY